jgi:opacity protein-like surface antigen
MAMIESNRGGPMHRSGEGAREGASKRERLVASGRRRGCSWKSAKRLRRTPAFLVAILLCLLSSLPALARSNRLGVRGGYHLFPSTPYLDRIEQFFPARTFNGFAREIFFQYVVGNEVGFEIASGGYLPREGSYTYEEISESGPTQVQVDMNMRVSYILATAKVILRGTGSLQPYLGGGVGHYFEKRVMTVTVGSYPDLRIQGGGAYGAHLVAGIDYVPGDWFGICLEARAATATVERVNNYGDDFDTGGITIHGGTFVTW